MNFSPTARNPITRESLITGTVAFCANTLPPAITWQVLQSLPNCGAFIIDHHGVSLDVIIHALDEAGRLGDLVLLTPENRVVVGTFCDLATGTSMDLCAAPTGSLHSEVERLSGLETAVPSDASLALLNQHVGKGFRIHGRRSTLTEARVIPLRARMGASAFASPSMRTTIDAQGLQELLLAEPATHAFTECFTRGKIFVWYAPGFPGAVPVGRLLLRQFRSAMLRRLDSDDDFARPVLCLISGAAESYLSDGDEWCRPGALSAAAVVDFVSVTNTAHWNIAFSDSSAVEDAVGLRIFCSHNEPLQRFKTRKWMKRAGFLLPENDVVVDPILISGKPDKGLSVHIWPEGRVLADEERFAAARRFWSSVISTRSLCPA